MIYQYTLYNEKGKIETIGFQEADCIAEAVAEISERWREKNDLPTKRKVMEKEYWRLVAKKHKEMSDKDFLNKGLYKEDKLKKFNEENEKKWRKRAEMRALIKIKYPKRLVIERITSPEIKL